MLSDLRLIMKNTKPKIIVLTLTILTILYCYPVIRSVLHQFGVFTFENVEHFPKNVELSWLWYPSTKDSWDSMFSIETRENFFPQTEQFYKFPFIANSAPKYVSISYFEKESIETLIRSNNSEFVMQSKWGHVFTDSPNNQSETIYYIPSYGIKLSTNDSEFNINSDIRKIATTPEK